MAATEPTSHDPRTVVMVDIDGTVSDYPHLLCEVLCSMKAAGDVYVAIVSGASPNSPSGGTWADKAAYLNAQDFTKCWDELVVVSGDVPALKAKWCMDHSVSMAIDNSIPNAKALTDEGVPLVLVPWKSRTKDNK